jgi:hypothetical protein
MLDGVVVIVRLGQTRVYLSTLRFLLAMLFSAETFRSRYLEIGALEGGNNSAYNLT